METLVLSFCMSEKSSPKILTNFSRLKFQISSKEYFIFKNKIKF